METGEIGYREGIQRGRVTKTRTENKKRCTNERAKSQARRGRQSGRANKWRDTPTLLRAQSIMAAVVAGSFELLSIRGKHT